MAHRSRQVRQQPEINHHHLLYEGRAYRRNHILNRLRNHHGLIVPLPVVAIHRPLHRAFPQGVPLPDVEAAKCFNDSIALPYEPGQPWDLTLEQAIGWFGMTDNLPTAEHLYEQHEFIAERLGVEYGNVA